MPLSSCHSERAVASRRIRFPQDRERIPPRAALGRNDILLNEMTLGVSGGRVFCAERTTVRCGFWGDATNIIEVFAFALHLCVADAIISLKGMCFHWT